MSFQERKKIKKQPDTYLDCFKKSKLNLFLKKESGTVNVISRKKKKTKKQLGTYLDSLKKPKLNLFLKIQKWNS